MSSQERKATLREFYGVFFSPGFTLNDHPALMVVIVLDKCIHSVLTSVGNILQLWYILHSGNSEASLSNWKIPIREVDAQKFWAEREWKTGGRFLIKRSIGMMNVGSAWKLAPRWCYLTVATLCASAVFMTGRHPWIAFGFLHSMTFTLWTKLFMLNVLNVELNHRNVRSQSCPFCRGSLKRVSSRDLWVLTGNIDVVDTVTLAKEDLRRFYLYIDNLPPLMHDTHSLLYDYMIWIGVEEWSSKV